MVTKPVQSPELVAQYTELFEKAPHWTFTDEKISEKIIAAKTIADNETKADEDLDKGLDGIAEDLANKAVGDLETVDAAKEADEDLDKKLEEAKNEADDVIKELKEEEEKKNPRIEYGNKGERFVPVRHNSHIMNGRRGDSKITHEDFLRRGKR